jgi:5-methyltetrahydrofolate--homocysteine methyltransferase
MKKAVAHLIPYMEAEKQAGKTSSQGKILLATVKGDVHDIGKNIVGVVLGCNNYEIIDLGVMVPVDKLLGAARDHNVDLIGLSGLITPSLDEMVYVAKEMQRQEWHVPLLIGGATTSAIHTAVKIAPVYEQPVVHVLDASRAVGIAGQLIRRDTHPGFIEQNKREQETARQKHAGRQKQVWLIRLDEARRRKVSIDWSNEKPPRPSFTGIRVLDNIPLAEIAQFIDWSPFFHTWEMKGVYPKILQDKVAGAKARELFNDAQRLLKRIVSEQLLRARAVYGFWPANAVEDDIELYPDESRKGVLAVIHTLRQQLQKAQGEPNYALADFIAPKSSGVPDYLGAFAVTTGHGLPELCAKFEQDHDDYNSIMAKALADRLAEALAEWLHKRAREDWGYGRGEKLSTDDLIQERYRGIRPAPGYPALPDHTEKRTLFDLLHAEEKAGIELTETYAMLPASSVSGFYFSHPSARYFSVGRIDGEQLDDYSQRKGMDMQRWLAANYANYAE